jgi:hypothetical protein
MEKKVHASYGRMADAFKTGTDADMKAWNCDAMYPAPVKTTMNIFETIKGAGMKGMEVFNKVKGALPEGTLDKIKIPGLPAGMREKFSKAVDYGKQAQDMAAGMGLIGGSEEEMEEMEEMEDFLEELKFLGGDSSATWAER